MFIEFDYMSGGRVLINTDQITAIVPYSAESGTLIYTAGSEPNSFAVMPDYVDVVSTINTVLGRAGR